MSEEESIRAEALLRCLVSCCEKAGRIARAFRGDQDDLFGLLVEEKSGIRKNRIMVQDFKTLADVLVQETIKRDVGEKFPLLSSKIQGEEQNSFQNTLGESIQVELTDSLADTTDLLCKVLDGKVHFAESLATVVHSSSDVGQCSSSSDTTLLPADRLGVWIDPIDSTAEFIQAKANSAGENGIELCGLRCVCVLIGVYDLRTGYPVIGIINQPFYRETGTDTRWESNIYWGIHHESLAETSASLRTTQPQDSSGRRKVIVTSAFESKQLQSLMESKYTVVHAAGAGYKCLVVAKAKASLYVLSLQNTHFWDTCGPHAILAAQGGGIVNFDQIVNADEVVDRSNLHRYQLKYLEDPANASFRNLGGIIAYRDSDDLLEFLEFLRENGYRHTK